MFTYTGKPGEVQLDTYRFLIGDTDENSPIMQDEEITYLISQANGDENLLRYLLFNQAAIIFSRDIKRSLGPESEDPTERLKFFTSQASIYKAKSAVTSISIPAYTYPKVFRKGMMENPVNAYIGGPYSV